MYPQLITAASRLAPLLARLGGRVGSFGAGPSLLMRAQGISSPDVSASPLPAPTAPTGPSVPISQSNYSPPTPAPQAPAASASSPLDDAQWPFGPHGGPSPLDSAMWPYGPNGAPSTARASVPVPHARPAAAPSAPAPEPDAPAMPWWQRNAAMMRDPGTGDFIDPANAAKAGVRGPDLIAKMMQVLHDRVST